MYYFVAVLILFAFMGLFYRIVLPTSEPNFELMGIQTDDSLRLSVMNLASESRIYKERGKGLSLRLISDKTRRAFKTIKQKIDSGEDCHDFEHWLYDNYYKLNQAIAHQKRLVLGYSRLPHTKSLPRIYNFLQLVVKASGGGYSKQLLAELTDAYCSIEPLTFYEINSIKNVLEYCLLEYISIFCSKAIVISSKIRLAKKDAQKKRVNLAQINYNSYVWGMERQAGAQLLREFSELCATNGLELRRRLDNYYRQVSVYAGNVQSAITNLHALVLLDDQFIIALSPLDQLLSDEPELSYNSSTLASKSVFLHRINKLARRRHVSELSYARTIIDRAKTENADIAQFILTKRHSKAHMRFYIFGILFVSIVLTIVLSMTVFSDLRAVGILLYPIVLGVVLMVLSEFLGVVTKRRYLPRREIIKSEYENCKTMILFSRLVADECEVLDAFKHLETIRYANSEPLFSYGVLIDFPASSSPEFDEIENRMINRCKECYENLADKERYNVFVRKRTLINEQTKARKRGDFGVSKNESKSERRDKDFKKNVAKYQGWEKKRGALLDLNSLILNNEREKFALILGSKYHVKYVIALDSDTLLNSGLELVQIMEHPHNKQSNVVSLSIRTSLASANKTLFSRLMSGSSGLSNYTESASDAGFDIYGHGNYTGKGIYRVREFHDSVYDKFMDNRILSHDFIEGAMAGCANASENALDSFPSDFSAFVIRQQRWLRGDWQLLPYLLPTIKNRYNKRIKNPISAIDKWHIFCNLVASLIPIASFGAMMLALFAGHVSILIAAFSLNIFYTINALRVFALKNPKAAGLELMRQIYAITTLPLLALNNLYSICITIIRLIRKEKLLEWKVFAHSKGRISFWGNYASAIIVICGSILLSGHPIFYVLATMFLIAPLLDKILSAQRKEQDATSQSQDEQMLLDIAKRTWSFFEKQFELGLNLPCDNYQEYLNVGYAMRTSPTNIGMGLTSICCALELGLIDADRAEGYIERIISSIEKMPKWQGNLYNWIDVKTLAPLHPRYVSSVDSGNLVAGMLLTKYYVRHNDLKERINRLINETQLEKLYDSKRGLFYIGYNDSDKELDKNHYDLMASESILTYLVAIGCGKIDKAPWNNLSIQHVRYGGKLLYSWTGGLFEYLMPSIFFEYPKRGMLDSSSRAAVRANMKYASKRSLDFWGISECQYDSIDNNGCYQYKAFGVPNIALANPPDTAVLAPYACCLALQFSKKQALKNIRKMIELGMLGEYGFYDSCDQGELIKTYMSHHQGMILCSITNLLKNSCLINNMREQNGSVRAAELLLSQPQTVLSAAKKIRTPKTRNTTSIDCELVPSQSVLPRLNFLSSGKYNLAIDQNGRGYSLYEDVYISRPDLGGGTSLTLTLKNNNYLASNIPQNQPANSPSESQQAQPTNSASEIKQAQPTNSPSEIKQDQPANSPSESQHNQPTNSTQNSPQNQSDRVIDLYSGASCVHNNHNSEYTKVTNEIASSVTAAVLPNISGEVRSIKIKNLSSTALNISLLSSMQISLSAKDDYLAHKAYSNMFIRSQIDKKEGFLLLSRKNKKSPFVAHFFNLKTASTRSASQLPKSNLDDAQSQVSISYCANRAKLYSRASCSKTEGSLLDSCLSGELEGTIEPAGQLNVDIFTLVSYDLDYLIRQIKMVRSQGYLKRVRGESFSISKLLNPNVSAKQSALKLLLSPAFVVPDLECIGVNIDSPLVRLALDNINSIQRMKITLKNLMRLYKFDISFNLIILYREKDGYFCPIRDALTALIKSIGIHTAKTAKSTIILLNEYQLNPHLLTQINNCATDIEEPFNPSHFNTIAKPSILTAKSTTTTAESMTAAESTKTTKLTASSHSSALAEYTASSHSSTSSESTKEWEQEIKLRLGIGGFLEGGSYYMNLTDVDTPAPWSNIIANKQFGTLITESGGGYTYWDNSRECKLTSWCNDFLEDAPSESVILQEGSKVWSITKKPITTNSQYHVIHSFGYSQFFNNYNGFDARERQYIHNNTKFFDILIKNKTNKSRQLSLAGIFEVVLGSNIESTAKNLEFKLKANRIIVTNRLTKKRLFIQSNKNLSEYAFYREQFSDAKGQIDRACAFTSTDVYGFEKCVGYAVTALVEPFGEERIIFSIGTDRFVDFGECDTYFDLGIKQYSDLSSLKIKTGNLELDYLLKWLPYQVLNSRFYARTGFYQAGGAKGFRDQLQDCLAILYIDPSLVRKHILDAAAHQFEDGDVQHWWHEPAVGVRTKISDDKLFLPYVVAEYIKFTGDVDILKEEVAFLKNIDIPQGKSDIYAAMEVSQRLASIHEHCLAAIRSALEFGENGLMLMGGGDWNDAMDKVGIGGKGTTVWGSMFLYHVLERYLVFVDNEADRELFNCVKQKLRCAVNEAWDGEWFLRAFTDDGRVIGSNNCTECKIDLITQSFAAITRITDDDRINKALLSAVKELVDEQNGIIRLLAPPFSDAKGIGYIANYPRGVRENGGQYTHAAVWYIIALLKSGKTELAYKLLNMINPVNHSKSLEDVSKYAVEPYVMAADVYSGEHGGRGGWTWYTGAAAWMYKCIVENLLGVDIANGIITINPNLPKDLTSVEIEYKTDHGVVYFKIDNNGTNAPIIKKISKVKSTPSGVE